MARKSTRKAINLGSNKWESERDLRCLLGERRTITGASVATILDDFLAFCYENRAERR